MPRFINPILNFFRPLSAAQKTLFGILTVGVILLIGLLFHWALQPSYSVLFKSLSSKSAQTIVAGLQSSNVSYRLADNGHTILVPRNKVYSLRLKYADSEVSDNSYEGYKLFDNNMLGMTDFMQRINKKRALEGELAHTINSLKEVKSSRVHIVLPKRAPFQESKVKPSASVVLEIKPNHSLSNKQIRGITALVAGSIAKMKPDEVVILDQHGNELSKNQTAGELAAGSGQVQLRQRVEQYLTQKGQSTLDRVVGPGNGILRVSTDLNFNKITRQSNTVDPDSRTIISEEQNALQKTNRTQQPNAAANADTNQNRAIGLTTTNAQQNRSNIEVKNYVVSRIKEHFKNTPGDITHISASVVLNYKPKKVEEKDGSTKTMYVPHSKKEIAKIKQVMHSTLGLNNKRGDIITVTQMKFEDAYNLQPQPTSFFGDSFTIYEMLRWILIAVIAAVIGYLMYRTSKKMKAGGFDINQLLEGTAPNRRQDYLEGKKREKEKSDNDIYTQKLSDKAREQINKDFRKFDDINKYIDDDTMRAARLVRKLMQD
jgi:flagellar M-ring protein FliF